MSFNVICPIHYKCLVASTLKTCLNFTCIQPEILVCGEDSSNEGYYTRGSLFDSYCGTRGEKHQFVLNIEEHMQKYTESYGLQRFGAFWFDYISTLDLPETGHCKCSRTGHWKCMWQLTVNIWQLFLACGMGGGGIVNVSWITISVSYVHYECDLFVSFYFVWQLTLWL